MEKINKLVLGDIEEDMFNGDSFRSSNYASKIFRFDSFVKVRNFLNNGGKRDDIEWSLYFQEHEFNKMLKKYGQNRVLTRRDIEYSRDNPDKPSLAMMFEGSRWILTTLLVMLIGSACGAPLSAGENKVLMCGDSTFLLPKSMPEGANFQECCTRFGEIHGSKCYLSSESEGGWHNKTWHRLYRMAVEGIGNYRGSCQALYYKCRELTEPEFKGPALRVKNKQTQDEIDHLVMPEAASAKDMYSTEIDKDASTESDEMGGGDELPSAASFVLKERPKMRHQPNVTWHLQTGNAETDDNPTVIQINHDGCKDLEAKETYIKLIDEKELCIVKCENNGKHDVSFDTRSSMMGESYKRPECWEETKEQYMSLEDRDIIKEILESSFDGTRKITVCELDTGRDMKNAIASFKIWISDKPSVVSVWESCKTGNLPKTCKINIKGGYTEVTVELKAKFGSYDLHIGSEVFKGYFKDSKLIRTDFEKSGETLISGSCNDIPFKRRVIVTSKEYCDEKYSGVFEYHWNIHCKHHRVIWVLTMVIGCATAVYCLSRLLAAFLSALIAMIFTATSYCCLNRLICQRCSRFKLPGKGHICNPKDCVYCGATVLTESDLARLPKEEIQKVMEMHKKKSCTSFTTDRPWALCLINYYRLIFKTLYFIMRQAPALTIGVCTIWLLGIYQGAEAVSMKELHDKLVMDAAKCVGEQAMVIMTEIKSEEEKDLKKCSLISITPIMLVLVTSLILFILQKPISMVFKHFCGGNNRRLCKACGTYRYSKLHRYLCKKIKCPRCDVSMGLRLDGSLPESITNFIWGHIDTCESIALQNGETPVVTKSYMKFVTRMAKNIFKFGVPISTIISFSVLVGCLQGANANHLSEMHKQESDLSNLISDLKKEGFHPYHARFSGGMREDISAVEEITDCSQETCTVKMIMQAELVVREGREYGYTICPKKKLKGMKEDGCVKLNVKIGEVYTECDYKDEYKTGKVHHRQYSSDTCTEGCSKCQDSLNQYRDFGFDIYEFNHENTASWSCDGPGCMAINNGCTCGFCYCQVVGDETEVKAAIREEPHFELCMQVGGEGFCKTVNRETRGRKVFIIKEGETTKFCPELIACKDKNCLRGEINRKGEFDNKFGAVQMVGTQTATKREDRYQEHCLFAKHRWVSYDQCCKDTQHMERELDPSHLVNTGKHNQYRRIVDELGTWKIRIELPTLTFHKNVDHIKLKNLEIKDCRGCADCDEGGSCSLHYASNLAASVNFECEECRTDVSHILINKGVQSTRFNVFCKEKKSKLTCKVGESSVTTEYKLLDRPKTPHGDGVIVMDKERFVDEKCKTILCGLKFSFWNIWSWALYLLIALAILVVIIVAWKSISGAFQFFKKIR